MTPAVDALEASAQPYRIVGYDHDPTTLTGLLDARLVHLTG